MSKPETKRSWKRGDWQIEAAAEIEDMLSRVVRHNTGLEFGYFAGVSLADMAEIIEKWQIDKNDEKYYIYKDVNTK